jgi:hypothetical protein
MKRLFHKRFSRKMLSGVEMIKMGILDRLAVRYKGIYGQETADSLAAAIVNELFCQKPVDPHARDFFTTNKEVIERELTNLKYDDEICKIITQAIRIKASLSDEHSDDMIKSMNKHVDKLTKLGIFIPNEYTPTPNFFLQIANEFYQGKQ